MNEYCTVPQLKERGWTDGTIEKYLKEPDKLAKNPYGKSKPPMRLYLTERVDFVVKENHLADVLKSNLEKRDRRSKSALRTAKTKREEIMRWVESLPIEIPFLGYSDLIALACSHYNTLHFDRAIMRGKVHQVKEATISSDADFLYRISHNFLRHQQTKYELLIEEMFGRAGREKAYEFLKGRITAEIDRTYPELMQYLLSSGGSERDTGILNNSESYSKQTKQPPCAFEVGQTVKIIKPGHKDEGKSGSIIQPPKPSVDGGYWLKIEISPNPNDFPANARDSDVQLID